MFIKDKRVKGVTVGVTDTSDDSKGMRVKTVSEKLDKVRSRVRRVT